MTTGNNGPTESISGLTVEFDAFWWVDGPTSGRNVLTSIVSAWLRVFPQDVVYLRTRRKDSVAVEAELGSTSDRLHVAPVSRLFKVHALAAALTRPKSKPDLVITQNFANLRAAPSTLVATFLYDALFVTHPEWFTFVERVYLAGIRPLLPRADIIYTISQSENERIGSLWPQISEALTPVRLGVPIGLRAASGPPADRVVDVGGRMPFLLSVGRLNARKNIGRLVKAFLSRTELNEHQLLIVGRKDGSTEDIDVSNDRVVFLGTVSDDDLKWLYSNAELFVFPSLDEGFGLPLIEAALFGCKVVASDIPVFREAGIAVAYFDPRSVDSIAQALVTAPRVPVPPSSAELPSWDQVVIDMRQAAIERRSLVK